MVTRRVPETDLFGRQNASQEQMQRGVDDALRFDGSQFVRLYEKMQALIANLSTTVTGLVNTIVPSLTYTRTDIDTKVTNPGAISPTSVTTSGDVQVGGQFRDPDAASYNITGTRLTVWVETATGRLGNTASSRKYKQDERPSETDPLAVLSIEDKAFNYIAEIRKRDDPTYEEYVGPDYEVADERGFMAEDLHDAGLNPWVIYRDVDGVPEPESVDYVMWVVAQQAAVRHLHEREQSLADENAALRSQVAAILAHLNLDPLDGES